MPILSNNRWEKFCHEIVAGASECDAYANAGYKCKAAVVASAGASRLLKKVKIVARIEELQKEAAARNGITVDRVLEEIRRIALADPRKLFDQDTGELKPVTDLDDETSAALAGVDVTEIITESKDGQNMEVRRVKRVKQWDKLAALEKCCRYLGIAKEQVEQHTKVEIVTPTDWLDDDD